MSDMGRPGRSLSPEPTRWPGLLRLVDERGRVVRLVSQRDLDLEPLTTAVHEWWERLTAPSDVAS